MSERPDFPIAFRGFDPDAVNAHLDVLEAELAATRAGLAKATADAHLAELQVALLMARDTTIEAGERSRRVEEARDRLRQSVEAARAAKAPS